MRVSLTQRVLTEQLEFVKIAKDQSTRPTFRRPHGPLIVCRPRATASWGARRRACCWPTGAAPILATRTGPSAGSRFPGPGTSPRTPSWTSSPTTTSKTCSHQKYKSIDEVRRDYPNIIRLFKNSTFPPTWSRGCRRPWTTSASVPLIVRSSSLLEDRVGTAFSGKYKSLFLANQGTKQESLAALLDAVAEVYASMFGPDPIQYRRERGVLEFDEQMGILIQEVVGTPGRRVLLPGLRRRGFQQQRVPLVAAHHPRGRAGAAGAGSGHAGGGPHRRRLPGAAGAGQAGAAGQRRGRRDRALLAAFRWTWSTWRRTPSRPSQ